MKYTENYKLKKPEPTDSYNVEDFNNNADALDAELKKSQNPEFTEAEKLENINTGEKYTTIFGKVKKSIAELISHLTNKKNPHEVTLGQIGAAAASHKHAISDINGLSVEDISSDFMTHNTSDTLISATRISVFKQGNVITGHITFRGEFSEAGGSELMWTVNDKYIPAQSFVNLQAFPTDDTTGYGSAALLAIISNKTLAITPLKYGYSNIETTFSYICE